ncbi:hypothetical protein SO694_00020050 [Aureococcus anophagefferens]|uniref:RxLR effector protein n=1 Tax=Aureococcus anophagefferens TaxID=44056 RepID=A0ABR1FTV8_AURAN
MRSAALILCCSTAVALAPANYQILRGAKVLRRAVEPDPRTVDGRRSARAKEPGQAFGFAPPLTVNKWETMQAKRVRLEVLYSRDVDVGGDDQRTLHREIMRARKARRPSTTYYRLEAVDDDDDDEYPRVVVPDK